MKINILKAINVNRRQMNFFKKNYPNNLISKNCFDYWISFFSKHKLIVYRYKKTESSDTDDGVHSKT